MIGFNAHIPTATKGCIDHKVFRALPHEVQESIKAKQLPAAATSVADLAKPKWVVDRSKLKFGMAKTSWLAAFT